MSVFLSSARPGWSATSFRWCSRARSNAGTASCNRSALKSILPSSKESATTCPRESGRLGRSAASRSASTAAWRTACSSPAHRWLVLHPEQGRRLSPETPQHPESGVIRMHAFLVYSQVQVR